MPALRWRRCRRHVRARRPVARRIKDDRAGFKRPGPGQPCPQHFGHQVRIFAPHFDFIFQRFGRRHIGHGELMVIALLQRLEGCRQNENLLALLRRHHPPDTEAAAIARTVHFVKDRHPRIAGAQDLRVQRMTDA